MARRAYWSSKEMERDIVVVSLLFEVCLCGLMLSLIFGDV